MLLLFLCLSYAPFTLESLGFEESSFFPPFLSSQGSFEKDIFYKHFISMPIHSAMQLGHLQLALCFGGDVASIALYSLSLIHCPVWLSWWIIQVQVTWFWLCNWGFFGDQIKCPPYSKPQQPANLFRQIWTRPIALKEGEQVLITSVKHGDWMPWFPDARASQVVGWVP